ncbi:hypothetical protein [Sutterella wadsworthensis]|uniref:hypothetical protein n=1 Tax=Sutterella wadsworthensis TaxID=40545 RepID=UPI003966ED85
MRADSGEVLKGCAPERFLNEFLACSLLSKPREAPEWISGEKAPAAIGLKQVCGSMSSCCRTHSERE